MDIFIMTVDIEKPFSEYEKYIKFISEKRKRRIAGFRFDKDKIVSLCSELLIRCKLSEILNTKPNEIIIETDNNGKPYVSNFENIFFSLSHSGDMILLAIDTCRIGADIELIKKDNTALAKSFFTNGEYDFIINSEDSVRSFYMVWTMKEAYLKMTGEGIINGLDNFDVFNANFNKMLKNYSDSDKYMTAICKERWDKKELNPVKVNIRDILGCFLP